LGYVSELDTIAVYGYVSVTVYVLIVDFLGLATTEWFLYSLSFHFVNKIFVFFKFRIYYILLHFAHIHGNLEVIYFSDPMMKMLPVERSWRTMEPSGVERMMKRSPEVSRSDLEKSRSKNFKILGEP